jgi:hypothetical protein
VCLVAFCEFVSGSMMADGVLTARRGEERLREITLLVAAQAHSGLAQFAECENGATNT